MDSLKEKIEKLDGPILVLGASGFIGCNIFRAILQYRDDVSGSIRDKRGWRLKDVGGWSLCSGDVNSGPDRGFIFNHKPKTVFDCIAYGSYPFQKDFAKIQETNVISKYSIMNNMIFYGFNSYIHAGSSSEYGIRSAAPLESDECLPNSDYAESKRTWSKFMDIGYHSHHCCNLRLYSVYGPYEDGSRLIPQVITHGLRGEYPPFVRPDISRDFVYVDDVVEAFIDAANNLKPEDYGGSFNIGTGVKTSIEDVADIAAETFGIRKFPSFSMPQRDWDHATPWYANPTKARERLGWTCKTSLADGLRKTVDWYESMDEAWEWPTLKPPTA